MAGGIGERFWPYSRQKRPKQLLKIVTKQSFLEEVIRRIIPFFTLERIFLVTNGTMKKGIQEEIPDFPEDNIICEPMGRNTSACLALAEVVTSHLFGDPTMAVLTADHLVHNSEVFLRNIEAACSYAEDSGGLVTLGIPPTRPETGFGYIEAGAVVRDNEGGRIFRVVRFREKPESETVEKYLEAGHFYWNTGMFFWRNSVLRANLERFLPNTMEGMNRYRNALGTPEEDQILSEAFEKADSISIDYALMEKAENVFMAQADFEWDDIGTWNALERLFPKDEKGNLLIGRGEMVNTRDTLIYNPETPDAPLVTAFGLKDILIVVDRDVIMVCPKSEAPKLKSLVEELYKKNLEKYL
jgi:mannose-1-phosphate guanylyltransferase